ncbi:vacuolar protein sorting-associated protein 53 [Klebsormidium nitens]|uniref:Vacuolar protein sorting-associated protein 53 n=1 Tax=Klebsormidium nitens TaxID=105231 RepID=A0A1Y1I380_KLENI|nr:vacuolar protein sorting-associated protein 53 [Klebsormidium nitens]|eukprot:GAQ83207.1 vacuolar protein sorting-associated protein 53 [Klebsormidium nitens]
MAGEVLSPSATPTAKASSEGVAADGQLATRKELSVAVFDRPDFNTIDFINQIFPNEASLVAVDPLIHKLRFKIRRVDAEILAAVRQQSSSGSKAKEDLASAMTAIQELYTKVREIKAKAEQSEVMVQEICRDIKKLDYAKKHITTTITALHRLSMLVSAVDQLQYMAAKRQYKDAAGQLEAVNQLVSHFQAYQEIPKISELRSKFDNVKQTLKSHIFSDFSSLNTTNLKENPQLQQQLADSCLVVDALDAAVKEELIQNICSKELNAYQQIFQGTVEVAKLEKAERRYAWIKRELRAKEDVWAIFPHSWRVPYLLCMQFCKVTRAQLMEILDMQKDKSDVGTLLQALQRTLEFEEELAERFGGTGAGKVDEEGGGTDEEGDEDDGSNAAQKVKGKYRKQNEPGEGEEGERTLAHVAGLPFSFRGTISSCFEPYMGVYVSLEETTLLELVDKQIADETWEAEPGSQSKILPSSAQVFLHIKKSLKRCTALTRSQTLFNLFKTFQKVLKAYATKLGNRLPKTSGSLMAAATGTDWQVKVTEKDERVVCYIINTGEYCSETAGQLAESVAKVVDAQFVEQVDVGDVQDEFSGVITRALSILVLGMETRLDQELAAMTKIAWGTVEAVGDQSEYVNGISSVLSTSVPVISGLLSSLYFQYFMDKLAASFAPRFYVNIFKCKRISEMGAQQMLLDTHAVKTLLLEVPQLGGQSSVPASYSKYVTRELGRAEALLKVILAPVEAVADTFRALLADGSASDFQKVLDLKGLKKNEQQPLLDQFNRRVGSSSPAPSTATAPPSQSSPLVPTSSGAAAFAQSARPAMEKAAAIGRGAMAQSAAAAAAAVSSNSLKRIFALADAAKDSTGKKEGTFRNLFNKQPQPGMK